MPGASRTQQKAEARYNVTTQFPQYDLHFAAASGNLGLVEFALSHGQPINSVLNGVLPLHAACAGGSEVVVKYLIDEGADVNAPRIPRRYSNEKHKSSGLAVGASGSTPLHFAAANGHIGVVRLLLAHGAVPDRADKHGVTPEMLARENGWVECANVLAAWSGGRAGDLPPVQPGEASASVSAPTCPLGLKNRHEVGNGTDESEKEREKEKDGNEITDPIQSGSKRLHMKRSIDNALHLFKTPLTLSHHGSHSQLRERDRDRPLPSPTSSAPPQSHSIFPLHSAHLPHSFSQSHGGSPSHSHLHSPFHHHSHSTSQLQSQSQTQLQSQTPSPSVLSGDVNLNTSRLPSGRGLGEYTFYSASPVSTQFNPPDALGVPGHRRPSLPHIFGEPASPFQRRLSGRKRRPRSAGSDAEQDASKGGDGNTNNSGSGVNGRIAGTIPNGYNSPISTSAYTNMNNSSTSSSANTITARKLSSKISLRNLFRRGGGDSNANAGSNFSGSEPGSSSASASTSFNSAAPIYSLAFSSGAKANTPPTSPLSSSFAPSPSPMPGGARPGSWYRSRLGSESGGAGSIPVPRSPLVPTAVELHHQYSKEYLHEELEPEAEPDVQANRDRDEPVVAPRLHARPSILRGHNRSSSSQSASGTGTPSGTRTLRFEAVSTSPPNASPEPRWEMAMANPSAVRLRGTRSASSLRHGESYGYDEDEEEEEDYGTSIDPPESETVDVLGYEGPELEETTGLGLTPPVESENYKFGSAGRARGASFASTVSSSPGVSPEDKNAAYEHTEFPFSIERPPLTPISVTSESSVTTHHSLQDDVTGDSALTSGGKNEYAEGRKDEIDSRARGESFSSIDTDESTTSRNGNASSSASVLTDINTPSPGMGATMTPVLGGEDNDTDVPSQAIKMSPSSGAQADVGQKTGKSPAPMTPLKIDLRGISNLAEAEALVRHAQQAILASASLPQDGPESPGIPLAAQLAAYGEILALERRFARGEKQRETWGVRDDSDGEGEGADLDEKAGSRIDPRKPQSAKEARMALTQKRRDVAVRQRGATTGVAGSSLRQKGVSKASKPKRPHTAEGAPQGSWGTNHPIVSPSTSLTGADILSNSPGSASLNTHSRSISSPLCLGKGSEKLPNIAIIETTATPIDSPTTPDKVPHVSTSPDVNATDQHTIDDTRPSLPFRSRTPDPEVSSVDDFGVPLTRVATAPLQDTSTGGGYGSGGSYNSRGSSSALRSDPTTRRAGAAHKLAKMGFSVDAHHSQSPHHRGHNGHGAGRHTQIPDAYSRSPASSPGSSRSPSKARFGGIKSLVRGLKGKS